jgi:hypothetical protein
LCESIFFFYETIHSNTMWEEGNEYCEDFGKVMLSEMLQ